MRNNRFNLLPSEREEHGLNLFDPFGDFFDEPMLDRRAFRGINSIMKTDVKETKDKYIIDVEMPGVEKNDIALDLSDGYLTITAKREKNYSEEDKKENYIRRERSYGQMSRSFYVGDVKKEDVDAHLEKGVLQISVLKKNQKPANNRIEIR